MAAKPPSPPRSGRIVYRAVWLALAAPLPAILWTGLTGGMRGHDQMTERLGLWAFRILLAGFALSPLARLLRRPVLHRYKRTFGLFGFTYAACHGVYYFFYGRVWEFTVRTWQRRLYIPLGIAVLFLMIPLAITSTDAMRRWMAPRAWRGLHMTFYGTVLAIGVHALWQSNIDYLQPSLYLGLTVVLLIVRLPPVMQGLMRLTAGRRREGPRLAAKVAET